VPRSLSVVGRRASASCTTAAIVIVIGYLDLIRGGLVIAPLALVVGYVVLVPLSFLSE
jgi:hypothetical protein